MQYTLKYTQQAQPIKDNINLNIHDTLIIYLEENPTTGFRWSFNENNFLTLQEDKFNLQTVDTQNLIGNGGVREFKFKAVQIGEILLTLNLQRAWEKQILSNICVNIDIKE